LGELALVALHHAPHRHHGLAASRRLELTRLDNRIERLLLRRIDEAAGVDDDDLGVLESLGVFGATVCQLRQVPLAVHRILVTTERDESELHAACGGMCETISGGYHLNIAPNRSY